MKILNSFRIAFSMFSKIPVGRVDWNQENMKYSMCFVPLIGVVIGALQIGWWYLAIALGLNRVLCSVIAVIVPFLVTGGIHMDGFIDVVDAQASCATKDKKLEILKDPHIGAFAMLWSGIYLLSMVGAFTEIGTIEALWIIGIGYILSRATACFLSLVLKSARREGSLYSFTSTQEKGVVSGILVLWIVISMVSVCLIDMLLGIMILLVVIITGIWFWKMTEKNFGGITGDMAGYLIQILELIILYTVVVGEIIWRFI